jgi:hypothetical protein
MSKKEKKAAEVAPELEVEGPAVSLEDARRVLLAEQNAKMEACMREVDAVLRKHGCALDVSMNVTMRGVTPQVRVIPQPRQ